MVQCSIKGCSSRSDVHSTIKDSVHFHRVPKNPELRSKWMQAINKTEVSESTRICSKHFQSKNYYTTARGVRKLIVSAVPDKDLVNDASKISGNDEDDSEPSFIKTQFPRPRILKVTRLLQDKSKISQCSLQPNPNKAIGMPEVRVRLDPNEVRKKIGETIHVTTVNDLETTVMSEVEENPSEQQKIMETDPLQINTENKIRTPLERKLIKEVKKLRVLNQKRLEALNCLEEQNRRLLKRNNYLQQELDKCQRAPEVSSAPSQDFNFISL